MEEVFLVSASSVESVGHDLTRLYAQMNELRTQAEEYYNKALAWKGKRDDLNKKMSQLSSKLKEEREERNRANEKVAELKAIKQEFAEKLDERKNQIDDLETKKRESISLLKDDPDQLRERIRKLEWFLQTNVLSLGKENQVVKEISTLEKKLKNVKVIDEVDNELTELVDRTRSIRGKLNEYRTQMMALVKTSQDHHTRVVELKGQMADLKKEADDAHKSYLESFELASEALSKARKIHDQIRDLNEKLASERMDRKPDRRKDLEERIEKVVTQAYDKVKKGSKITMDELSVLVDKGFFNERQKP
jgi:uncharacterized coiled-coil DUF342 family protein